MAGICALIAALLLYGIGWVIKKSSVLRYLELPNITVRKPVILADPDSNNSIPKHINIPVYNTGYPAKVDGRACVSGNIYEGSMQIPQLPPPDGSLIRSCSDTTYSICLKGIDSVPWSKTIAMGCISISILLKITNERCWRKHYMTFNTGCNTGMGLSITTVRYSRSKKKAQC